MRRALYMAAFTLFAVAAALLTLRAQHTVGVVVALHDVRAGTQLQTGDVEVRRVHDDGVPDGTLASVSDAVGRYVAWPLTAGEPVLGRALRDDHSGGTVVAGMVVPSGYRAVAVPVQPAGAVGGMLATGDRVDVFGTPQAGHDASGAGAGGSPTTPGAASPDVSPGVGGAYVLGRDVLVLELRSDQGRALDAGAADQVHGLDFGSGRLGSVVLAVPEADVERYAAAAAADVIYLALSFGSS